MNDAKFLRLKAAQDPAWFYDKILKFPAFKWQIEASEAIMDVRRKIEGKPTKFNHNGIPRITIRSCHGTGKTQLLGMLIHLWNITTYGKIACTAPKQDQLTRRLMPRYRKAIRDSVPYYKSLCKTLGTEIVFCDDKDWGAVMETASDPENLAGYHCEPQLFIVDEASSRRLDPMYATIEGALSTPGSVIVEIGNPTRMDGEFYTHHCGQKVKHLYYRMHVKPEDATDIVSQDWLDAMATKYGKDSPTYLIRCRGEFASFDENTLIPLEYIDDSFNRDWEEDGSHPKLRVSVDVADGGADNTVVTAAHIYQSVTVILRQKSYNFMPGVAPLESARAAINMFEALGGRKQLDDFVVDANGVGAGTAGTLIESGYNIIRYMGGSKSDNTDRWRNRRVQCHLSMYEQFRDAKIVINEDDIDDSEELKLHLLAIKRSSPDKRMEDIITKEKIKLEHGFSPDRCDSMAMLFYDAIPETIDQEFHYTPIISQSLNYDASVQF